MAHANVRPIRVRHPDDEMRTVVVRGVGFRGVCSCGWVGPGRKMYRDARDDSRSHVCDPPGAA